MAKKIVKNINTVKKQLDQEKIVPESIELFASTTNLGNSRIRQTSRLETKDVKFPYINQGIAPYKYDNEGNINIQDTIDLCQKAYFNVAAFGNTIDIMSEFANADLIWNGKNKAAVKFFKAWAEKINLWKIADQFFREYYLTGNYIAIRIDTVIDKKDIAGYKEIYGKIKFNEEGKVSLPAYYVVLNPRDICVNGSVNFINPVYLTSINSYVLSRLKNPTTQADKDFLASLTDDAKNLIKKGKAKGLLLPLDPERLYTVFFKKADYYPLSIPFGYRVMNDIEYKLELRNTDKILARTVEKIILLITMGAPEKDGGMNPIAMEAMKELFKNESLGRVLVADYTTKASFIIPDVSAILGPEKYQAVNQDIKEGLMNIFLGEEKFSNTVSKVRVFVERLQNAQQVFLREFLMPEVRRICKIMGFKGETPTAEFIQIDLKDELQFARIYATLAQSGLLTGPEVINAIKTGELPSEEDSINNQKEFKKLKDEGLYQPVINQAKEEGRPAGSGGTKTPNRTTRVSGKEEVISVSAMTETFSKANEVINKIQNKYLKDNNKKKITDEIQDRVFVIAKTLLYNENVNDWNDKWLEYYNNLSILPDSKSILEVESIREKYKVSELLGIVIKNSLEEKGE